MGFFESSALSGTKARQSFPIALLHRQGCSLCPLNTVDTITSPKMLPAGPLDALVYILGDFPNEQDDKQGEPFAGRAGRFLTSYIPRNWRSKIRLSNVLNCRPLKRDPSSVETECCRPRSISDIEKVRPKVIFGLGSFALRWATGEGRIELWRGRRLPVQVGDHACWFYPMEHPSYIMQKLGEPGFHNEDQVFGFDIKNAFAEIPHLPEAIVHTKEQAQANLILIKGDEPGALDKVERFLLKAAQAPQCGVDYETSVPPRPYYPEARILTAAVSAGKTAMAFAWDHRENGWSPKDKKRLRDVWIHFLRTAKRKCVHGLSFEQEWTGVIFGIDLLHETRDTWEDSLTQAFTRNSWAAGDRGVKNGPLSLGWLTTQHFGLNIKKFSGVKTANLDNEPLEPVLRYNAVDARYHEQVFLVQEKLLIRENMQAQYQNLLERVPTTVLTKIKGIPTNYAITEQLDKEYSEELADIEEEIHAFEDVKWFEKKTKEVFEVSKNQQIIKLYNAMGTYIESADESALKEVDNPLSDPIIRWRKVSKRHNYVKGYMPGKGLWPDGLVHPDYSTAYVGTTRSSSFEPNIQNVIKRDEVGKRVRRQIEAPPGYVIVSVDQGQIQWRNIGMESHDKYLCSGLWSHDNYDGYDVHMEWAERLAHAYPDRIGGKQNIKDKKIMKAFRGDVKNQWVFPWCFGARRESREGYLGVPEGTFTKEDRLMEKLFSGVAEWKETTIENYRNTGYTTGLTGFRRPAPLKPNDICNSPIQADEAIVLFDGYNRLSKRGDPLLQANMEIHDDLEFILPLDSLYENVKIIVTDMLQCSFDWICTPLMVEVAIGKHWLSMHEVYKFRSDTFLGQPYEQFRFGDK
jgi:uracil-DNA glycosylase family 4